GRLNRDIIGNSVRWIGPEIRRYLLRRSEADVKIIGDRRRVETELQGPRPVDFGNEGRRIELLLEVGVGNARDRRYTLPQLMRQPQIGRAVAADHTSTDLRRQPGNGKLGEH